MRWISVFTILAVTAYLCFDAASGNQDIDRTRLESHLNTNQSRPIVHAGIATSGDTSSKIISSIGISPNSHMVTPKSLWSLRETQDSHYEIEDAEQLLKELKANQFVTLGIPNRSKPIHTTLMQQPSPQILKELEVLKGKVLSNSPLEHVFVVKGQEETMLTFQLEDRSWVARINNYSSSGFLMPDDGSANNYKIH